jgi:proton-coupled amino acid transporter
MSTSAQFREAGTSAFETFINLFRGNIGPGCLSLPFAFSLLGPVASPVLLCFLGFVTVFNMFLLLDCKQHVNRRVADAATYGEVALYSLGASGQRIVDFFVVLSQLSICLVSFSFVSDNLNAFWPTISQRLWIVFILIPLLGLIRLRTLHLLAPFSLAATVMLVVGVFLIVLDCVGHWSERPRNIALPPPDLTRLPVFFGTVMYCFVGIGLVLPMENQMSDPEQFPRVLGMAMVAVLFTYVVVGQLSLLSFGDIDNGSITAFLEERRGAGIVADMLNFMVSASVMLTFPLQFQPAIEVMERQCGYTALDGAGYSLDNGNDAADGADAEGAFGIIDEEQEGLVALSPGGATQIVGRESGNAADVASESQSSVATRTLRTQTVYSEPSGPPQCLANTIIGRMPVPWNWLTSRASFRMFVASCVAAVAAFVPQVSLAISLAGSTSACILALVVPPVMDLMLIREEEMVTQKDMSLRKLRNLGVILMGLGGTCFGTLVIIEKIFEQYGDL